MQPYFFFVCLSAHVFCPLNVGVGHVIEHKVESDGSTC